MIAGKLMQAVENASERIGRNTLRVVREDSKVRHLQRLADEQLLDWVNQINAGLELWKQPHGEMQKLGATFFEFGKTRYDEDYDLQEVIWFIHLWRESAVDFVRALGFERSALDVYMEEELEHDLIGFSDFALFHIVKGYEDARKGMIGIPALHAYCDYP